MSIAPQNQNINLPPDRSMQASGLSRLLHLFQQMRRSETVEELLFLAMNETRQIIAYDEALLFFYQDDKDPVLKCISGLATFERETPKIAWLEGNIAAIYGRPPASLEPVMIRLSELPDAFRENWQEFMSAEGVIVPFSADKARQNGFFLFTRSQPWTDKDARLLSEIAESFSYAYNVHALKRGVPFFKRLSQRKKKIWMATAAVVLIVLLWPVRETLIADMEISPISPWVATAPIDGVVRKILVDPNAQVHGGDVLFEMDDTTLRNDAVLANERLEIARQELWQARQQAVTGASADKKADASLLALELQKKENEVRYYEELLQKAKIFSATDGIAVFGAPSEIEGRPVRTGEAIMLIADPSKVELTINMPVADAINLKPGDHVVAYLHAAPFSPLDATVRYVSYKAQKTEIPDQYAYKIKADLEAGQNTPRLGLKGTARIKGERTTLFYALFRKPLGYVRRMTGI